MRKKDDKKLGKDYKSIMRKLMKFFLTQKRLNRQTV